MTYFHYYATTSRNLDRVLQYGVFPLAHAIGWVACKNRSPDPLRDASRFARWVSAGAYATLTTTFLGAESKMIDDNSRDAVAAEIGIEPDKLTFSDYKYSKNAIVSTAHHDMMRLQKYRYGTDAMFLMPTFLDRVYQGFSGESLPTTKLIQANPKDYNWAQILMNGHMAANYSVLAGKAMYWAGETYFIQKSGHYEVVKLIETLESTGKDLTVNDLLGVYQRTRANDRHLPMIGAQQEYDALRPLLQKVANAYNRHDGRFGISEIVYLIGLGKINIHADDNKTVSQEAVRQSEEEINKVVTLGLKGIREEKIRWRKEHGISDEQAIHAKSFRDFIGDRAVNTVQSILKSFSGKRTTRPEEYITVRDPGELTQWDHHNISR